MLSVYNRYCNRRGPYGGDNMRTNIMLDEESHKVIKELPKKMSASKLLRWLLKALNSSEKEWTYLIRHDPEIMEVQDWIRPKLRKALAQPDIEDEVKANRRKGEFKDIEHYEKKHGSGR